MSDRDKEKIKAACKMVGCKQKDLLKPARLTDEAVVLIVGPVGYKHVIPFVELDLGRGPFVAEVEAMEPPTTSEVEGAPAVSFEQLVPPDVWVILKREGLTDPEALRGKSDRALERIGGLGRATVKRLRQILEQLG